MLDVIDFVHQFDRHVGFTRELFNLGFPTGEIGGIHCLFVH